MKQLDYVAVKVWIKRERLNAVRKCAEMMGQPLATFCRNAIELHAIRARPLPDSD